jgi:hypothetical protein
MGDHPVDIIDGLPGLGLREAAPAALLTLGSQLLKWPLPRAGQTALGKEIERDCRVVCCG